MTNLLARGARLLDDDAGDLFVFGGLRVIGNFTGGDESVTLTLTGGKEENLRGTLVISRARYPQLVPGLMSIITDAAGNRYRIGILLSDAASWTLTLTHPNARRK